MIRYLKKSFLLLYFLSSIHPRYKQDIASRLLLSGLQVAYNITSLGRYQGPQITAFFIDIGYHTLKLEFDKGTDPIVITSGVTDGFEVSQEFLIGCYGVGLPK